MEFPDHRYRAKSCVNCSRNLVFLVIFDEKSDTILCVVSQSVETKS